MRCDHKIVHHFMLFCKNIYLYECTLYIINLLMVEMGNKLHGYNQQQAIQHYTMPKNI